MLICIYSPTRCWLTPPPLPLWNTAGGAVLIAAVGVWGVFKMAFWVAGETGRSMNSGDSEAAVAAAAAVGGDGGGAPRIPSPLEPPAARAARLLAG